MDEDEIKFTCQGCGQQFDPDPDTMVEAGMSAVPMKAGEDIPEGCFTEDQLREMDEFHLKEIGLTPQQRDELLATRDVVTGGMCICKGCQDSADGDEE